LNEFYLIAGMAVVTFGIRYSMFVIAERFEFPAKLENTLRFVPPAVLTAIIVPTVLIPNGETIELSYTNPYLVGALVAFGIGWIKRNLLLTIVSGMLAFWGWQWLLSL
jgi:branched-subunit amino acid transport protein